MKFSKTAFSVAALLGMGVVGGSWYTGKQVEAHYQALVEQGNQELQKAAAQYGGQVALKEVKLDRHFFSTDASYQLAITLEGETFTLIGNDTLYHGPFPLNRLADFQLKPVLMSMENRLQAPEQLESVFGKQLGQGVSNLDYTGQISGEFAFSAIRYQDEQHRLENSPIRLGYEYDKAMKNSRIRVRSEEGKLDLDGASIVLKGIDYEAQLADEQGYSNLGLGSTVLNIGRLEFKDREGKLSVVSGIKIQGENRLQGDQVVYQGTSEIEQVNIGGGNFGKFNLTANSTSDVKLMNELVPQFSDPALAESGKLPELFLKMFEKPTKLALHPMGFEHHNGKLNMAVIIDSEGIDPTAMEHFDRLVEGFSGSRFQLDVDRHYLESLARDYAMAVEKQDQTGATEQAKSIVNEVFATAGGSGIAAIDEDKIKIELHAENGKLILNGRELSEQDVRFGLFMLVMGLGSMGNH